MLAAGTAQAGVFRFCGEAPEMSLAQRGRLLAFAAVVRDTLEASGARVALLARSGIDLDRFAVRYSHAGISLRDSANARWSVRQLYYDCDERRPRVFDQGVAGFVAGLDDPSTGFVSAVLVPAEAAEAVERTALDNARALQLLGGTYSANAYPFSTRYQNCNQWVAELMALAADATVGSRADAQAWLHERGYTPTVFAPFRPLLWIAPLVPWLHDDDHPADDLAAGRYRVSMPESVDAFVHLRWPLAERIEFCVTPQQVVVRRGWQPLDARCTAQPEDRVVPLD